MEKNCNDKKKKEEEEERDDRCKTEDGDWEFGELRLMKEEGNGNAPVSL